MKVLSRQNHLLSTLREGVYSAPPFLLSFLNCPLMSPKYKCLDRRCLLSSRPVFQEQSGNVMFPLRLPTYCLPSLPCSFVRWNLSSGAAYGAARTGMSPFSPQCVSLTVPLALFKMK